MDTVKYAKAQKVRNWLRRKARRTHGVPRDWGTARRRFVGPPHGFGR